MPRLVSRRDFTRGLLAGGAGLFALILTSCGGASSSPTPPSTAAGTPRPVSPAAAAATTVAPTPTPTMSMPMSPVAAAASPVSALPAVPAASTATATAPATTVEVKIVEPSTNFNTWSYQPKSITVKAGTTVIWINTGGATHTVTADNKAFDSGSIAPDNRFQLKTSTVGTFNYHCAFHPWMKGTLIVTK